jgi:hypothetical protein
MTNTAPINSCLVETLLTRYTIKRRNNNNTQVLKAILNAPLALQRDKGGIFDWTHHIITITICVLHILSAFQEIMRCHESI